MKRFDTYLGRIAAAAILLVTGGFLSSCDKNDDGPKLDKITVSVSEVNATATTAVFIGVVERESKAPADAIVGFEYAKSEDFSDATEVTVLEDEFSEKVTGLSTNTKYYYRTFVEKKGQRTYGDIRDFTTSSVSASVETIATSSTKAEIVCLVDPEVAGSASLKAGVEVSLDENFAEVENIAAETITEDGEYTISMEGLAYNTYYYVRPYIEEGGNRIYGTVKAFATTGVKFALNVTLETALLRVFGSVEVDEADMDALAVGYQISTDPEFSEAATTTVVIPADQYGNYDSGNKFNYRKPSTDYYYRTYVYVKGDDEYYYNNFSPYTTDALVVKGYIILPATIKATSASAMPSVDAWDLTGIDEMGDVYSTSADFLTTGTGISYAAMQEDPPFGYSLALSGLTPATGYYYTYYIKRGSEYEYGPAESVLSFVTLPDASCISVNEVKPAPNPGQVTFTGSSKVSDIARTTYAITTSLEYATTEDFSDKVSESFTGNLSFQKNDLKPATTYYYRIALAYNDGKNDKTLYTAVKSFTTDEIALTCDMSTIYIKETSMIADMSIGYSGWDISGLEFGVILSTDPDCSLSSSDVINKPSVVDDSFGMLFIRSSFSDLTPGTTYYYRGYIKRNGEYAHWTEIKSATTKIVYPSVTFVKVEPQAPNMDFHINVANWDNEDNFKVGIQYGYTADLSDGTVLLIDRSKDNQSQEAAWKKQVNTKVPSITLYYRSCYAPVSDPSSYTYGEIKSCKMSDMDPFDLTFTLGEVTSNTASFSGTFFFLMPWEARDSKIQFGVICSTSENATVDTPGVVNVEMTAVKSGYDIVLEPATATGLAEGTTYYYRSYYKVGETVVYLHNGTFTTTSAPKTVEVTNDDLAGFTGASTDKPMTTTVGDLTLTLKGLGGGGEGERYAKLGTPGTSYLAIEAPNAIKEVNLTVDSYSGDIYVKESESASTNLASKTLTGETSAQFTLSGDQKTVYIMSSAKVNITALSVTY
ncbi:MAG: hypothetical protein ACI3Y9_05715 [Candidatus Cryptobacteroides sp.]